MRYSISTAAAMFLSLAGLPAPMCGAFRTSFQNGADPTAARSSAASAATYVAVLGVGVFAIQHEGSMNEAMARMATSSAAAAKVRAQIASDKGDASALEHEASADEAEAEDLLSEAKKLEEQMAEDEKEASDDEKEAEKLEERAKEEKKEANELLAQAESDEATYESVKEDANALSEKAGEDRAVAESVPDVRICRFWVFRSLCDALGTAARIRSEAAERAAEEAQEAAEEFARAKAVKDREEEERKEAGDLEAQAKEDHTQAEDLEGKSDEEKKRAEEEKRGAEKDELDAEAEEEKSKKEADDANALEAKVAEETKRANTLLEESIRHGRSAYKNGVLAAIFAGVVLAFFSVRIFVRYILQVAWGIADYCACIMHERNSPAPAANVTVRAWASLPKQKLSRFLVHCIGAVAVLATFSNEWMELESYSVRNRGGLVLSSSCLAGATQSLVLRALPVLYILIRSTDIDCEVLLEGDAARDIACETAAAFVRGFLFITTLISMEILILWINLGAELFGEFTNFFIVPIMWLLFVLGSWVHVRTFEIEGFGDFMPIADSSPDQEPCSGAAEKEEQQDKADGFTSERDALIKSDRSIDIGEFEVVVDYAQSFSDGEMGTLLSCSSRENQYSSTKKSDADIGEGADAPIEEMTPLSAEEYFSDLRLPFDILVVSCMVALLRECVPKCRQLLPVVHNLATMSSKHSSLQFYVICMLVIVTVLVLYYVMRQSYRRRRLSRNHSPAMYREV